MLTWIRYITFGLGIYLSVLIYYIYIYIQAGLSYVLTIMESRKFNGACTGRNDAIVYGLLLLSTLLILAFAIFFREPPKLNG